MQKSDKDNLEQLIDAYGIKDIFFALCEICYEKADHLRTNWQDEQTAKDWEKKAKAIDQLRSRYR